MPDRRIFDKNNNLYRQTIGVPKLQILNTFTDPEVLQTQQNTSKHL
jgi:hypothetical protein